MLRDLARRVHHLEAEAAAHEKAIRAIVTVWRADLLDLPGVGPINAAVVLTSWSHAGRCRDDAATMPRRCRDDAATMPRRCRDDAAFAILAGVAPIPASSGKTTRYRLDRAGDRQLNRALHSITLCRQRHDTDTRAYTDRRRAEGKTDREIRRRLKRYTARQLCHQLGTEPAVDSS